jgi:hypothetical protein
MSGKIACRTPKHTVPYTGTYLTRLYMSAQGIIPICSTGGEQARSDTMMTITAINDAHPTPQWSGARDYRAESPHGSITQREVPEPYERRVLLNSSSFEVMMATWRPGIRCAPHDHGGASGLVLLLSGSFIERSWELRDGRLELIGEEVLKAPAVTSVGVRPLTFGES